MAPLTYSSTHIEKVLWASGTSACDNYELSLIWGLGNIYGCVVGSSKFVVWPLSSLHTTSHKSFSWHMHIYTNVPVVEMLVSRQVGKVTQYLQKYQIHNMCKYTMTCSIQVIMKK